MRGGCWRTLWLLVYGRETVVAADFPRTVGLLRSTPATTAMFSILQPGCSIDSHQGENKAVRRYHLGIEVPPVTGEETLELRVSDNGSEGTANGSRGRTGPTCSSMTRSSTR